nr:FCD domain-containing protein [Nonomuraea polychroma]
MSPNHVAKAVYLSMTRFITEMSEHADPDDGRDEDYLRLRLEVHAELVNAIIAGDVARTVAAVERHHAPS